MSFIRFPVISKKRNKPTPAKAAKATEPNKYRCNRNMYRRIGYELEFNRKPENGIDQTLNVPTDKSAQRSSQSRRIPLEQTLKPPPQMRGWTAKVQSNPSGIAKKSPVAQANPMGLKMPDRIRQPQ